MKIFFINNYGGGFADVVEINDNTTIQSFIKTQMPEAEPSSLMIRVNRNPVEREYVLREGDRVSATPTKIDGAVG